MELFIIFAGVILFAAFMLYLVIATSDNKIKTILKLIAVACYVSFGLYLNHLLNIALS